ncbi:MAG: dihydropteroate synthase [Bacteroidota bacterium]|nr:dihydropteroate synthase [Bacteroidota bacterium]MDP3145090.1 dihydropteroate synthase [Bacteroidota bacterium]
MAIVNITPDSFYDGGKYSNLDDVLRDIEEKIAQGADIIDVGAASSRPNSKVITKEEEWQRLTLYLPEIRKKFPNVFISIDTFHSGIAKKSAEMGVDIINDISGGNLDENMFDTVAKLNLPYILMHIQGTPQTMQKNPLYNNVVLEVKDELSKKIEQLKNLNFKKIIVDVGFGFGKTQEHNYTLLKNLTEFNHYPILAGFSRKSMITKIIGTNPVTSLNGTTVLNTIALLNGASILRVHDVTEAKQAIDLIEFYKSV